MSILVVGSIALDSVETPFGKVDNALGGSALYFSNAASLFSPVNIVGVVGNDFDFAEIDYLKAKGCDFSGMTVETGETFRLKADQVFKAIGQALGDANGRKREGGKIAVDGVGRTSRKGVWAGGDCASGGDDLTVTAVAEGRDAAEDIHATLMGRG